MSDCVSADNNAFIALFGGTFDPIHNGHLFPVEALAKEIGICHISLLPNNVPPHRPQPEASTEQRVEMLRLAIEDNPLFSIDERELHRTALSYTIDTLEEVRKEYGADKPIAFIIGQDSLLTLHTWDRWQEFLSYCHLLVCGRPGYANHLDTPELEQWLNQHRTQDINQLKHNPCGYIYLAHTPLLDVSATDIRARRRDNDSYRELLPAKVQRYIQQQGLYR
jgi:nicotinate-nucleotide adenylyltransferase